MFSWRICPESLPSLLIVPSTPPAYAASAPDANVSTSYQFDSLGRTTLVQETGFLSAPTSSGSGDLRVTTTEYDQLSRPLTVTLNPTADGVVTADRNRQSLTRYDRAGNVVGQRDAANRWTYYQGRAP